MEFTNIEGLDKLKRRLDPKLVKKAEPMALNKTAAIARTDQSKEIRKTFNITAKRLNQDLEKVSGSNKATANNLRSIVKATKKSNTNPGLQNFGAKQTRKGVSYRIRKDQGRKNIPGAFKTNMPKGGEGIFLRTSKDRLPIVRKTGPSVVQMMTKIGIAPVQKAAKNNFPRLFLHEYQRQRDRTK